MTTRSPLLPKSVRGTPFTLIEILTVLAVVGIIMGVAVTAVNFTPSVDASARAVSRQLYLARQYAISRRTKVAVLFPNEDISSQSNWTSYRDYCRRAVRVCKVSGTGPDYTFDGHLPGTQWVFLPKNNECRLFNDASGNFNWPANTLSRVDDLVFLEAGGTQFDDIPAIVFLPNGSLANPFTVGSEVSVLVRKDRNASSIGKNDPTTDDDTGLIADEAKQVKLTVRGLTGRVEYNQVD